MTSRNYVSILSAHYSDIEITGLPSQSIQEIGATWAILKNVYIYCVKLFILRYFCHGPCEKFDVQKNVMFKNKFHHFPLLLLFIDLSHKSTSFIQLHKILTVKIYGVATTPLGKICYKRNLVR